MAGGQRAWAAWEAADGVQMCSKHFFYASGAALQAMNHHQAHWHGPHPPGGLPGMAACSYSIKAEFDDAVVLITGASGYIGSVVLEQLLRTTNVARVYLLLRPRRGQSIQQRAKALLQGPLFHKVC